MKDKKKGEARKEIRIERKRKAAKKEIWKMKQRRAR
jgi:hypothetical protein